MGAMLTNYHYIIDARDPVAAEPPARIKREQSSPLLAWRNNMYYQICFVFVVFLFFLPIFT